MDPLIARKYILYSFGLSPKCADAFVTAQKFDLLTGDRSSGLEWTEWHSKCANTPHPPTFLCKNIIPGELFVQFV